MDEDDKIIEYWDVIVEYVDKMFFGYMSVDGLIEIKDLDKMEENKVLV